MDENDITEIKEQIGVLLREIDGILKAVNVLIEAVRPEEKTKEWICPKGHTFTLRSGYFRDGDECRTYLDPKIGAEDSPCLSDRLYGFNGGCTEEEQEGCVLTVAAYFEGECDE